MRGAEMNLVIFENSNGLVSRITQRTGGSYK